MRNALERGYVGRKYADRAARAVSAACVAMALVPLVALLVYVVRRGALALSPAFFVDLPHAVGERGGGMANAIVGTVELVGLASAIGVPLGIAGGLWLAEYRDAPMSRAMRFCADILAGVPSILVGIVIYALVVVRMKHFSALAGALALAVMMLPLVARSTDTLARAIPPSLREAALALGAPRWRIAVHVVLPTISRGVRAGTMLAVARVAGETAPLLFTAFNNRFWSESLLDPTSSLGVQIFTYSMSPYDDAHAQAWAAALVLVAMVVVLDVAARRLLGREGTPS